MGSGQAVYQAVAQEVFSSERATAVDVQPLGAMLLSEFLQAKAGRALTQDRWVQDLRQYKGQYSSEELAQMQGMSRAFVRKTRTKVKTIDARVADMLFPTGGEQSWGIAPTPKPQLSAMQEEQVAQALQAMTKAGEVVDDAQVQALVAQVAKQASDGMQQLIADQLVETGYRREAVRAIHDCHVYGTGVLKGPVVSRRARTSFVRGEDGKFTATSQYDVLPRVEHVPLWQVFPDMSAADLEGCRYIWQRHILSANDLAQLTEHPGFEANAQRIRNYLLAHPKGHTCQAMDADAEIRSMGLRDGANMTHEGYEVLERWGWLTGVQLRDAGVHVAQERWHESFFGCVWLLASGEVIRAHLSDIDGTTWPYHFYHFDKDETSFFGEGISAIMRDDQAMINAATRMLLDNAALSAGPMFEVSPHLLDSSAMNSLNDIHAWRVWLRNSQSPGQRAIIPVGIDGRLGDVQALRNLFEVSADETTAIPRYMTGENVSAGAAGTASGMSMLMAAANIVIKDLITSWDEGITKPLMEALYRWNMRYSPDHGIKGDYQVHAKGASSLVAKEVRSRQLNEFAMMTGNPLDAPFVKRDVLLRLRAQAHELPDVVKSVQEVQQEMQAAQQQASQDPALQVQQQMVQLQMQEAQAKVQELAAKAQETLARAKLQEARAQEALANVDVLVSRNVDLKMQALYASLQAAGIVLQNPQAASVADAISKDAGYVGTAQLEQEALKVQAQQQTQQGQQQPQAATDEDPLVQAVTAMGASPATGHAGLRRGVQTADLGDGA